MDSLQLDEQDRSMLGGEQGTATAVAMRLLVRLAEIEGARSLLDIELAYIDSCLYHGQAGLDFALMLRDGDATVSVPATLNVSSLDLLHPELYRGDESVATAARRQMKAYVDMGCRPTWTCAPYQIDPRPGFGAHIAWAESNAIVFANSVLGARTNRNGDFIDICAAITGRAPATGLHLDENRGGELLLRVTGIEDELLVSDSLFPVLGHLVGEISGSRVPVITGLPTATEDQLKALGAAAASSGGVALFHIFGITPEAPDLESLFPRGVPDPVVVDAPRLRRGGLGTAPAAILLEVPDAIVVVGALVAAELYGKVCPVVTVDFFEQLSEGLIVSLDPEREVLDVRG